MLYDRVTFYRTIQDPEAYHGVWLRTIPAPAATSACKAYRHAPGGCRDTETFGTPNESRIEVRARTWVGIYVAAVIER